MKLTTKLLLFIFILAGAQNFQAKPKRTGTRTVMASSPSAPMTLLATSTATFNYQIGTV